MTNTLNVSGLNPWPTVSLVKYVGAHRLDSTRALEYSSAQARTRIKLHREIHSTCEHGRTQDRHLVQ